MKKIIIVSFLSAIILTALTGCAKKAAVPPTLEDIYAANGYETLKAKHTSTYEQYAQNKKGSLITWQIYFDKDCTALHKITEDDSETYFCYYSKQSTAAVYTDGQTHKIENFATVNKGEPFSRIKSHNLFKRPDNGGEELQSSEKTEKGWLAVVVQKQDENVEKYANNYMGRSRLDGEYIKYDLELNEDYEITALHITFVAADGSGPVNIYNSSVQYDLPEAPDFLSEGKAVLDSQETKTVTLICEGKEIDRQTVYGPVYILRTDYRVYADEQMTTPIEAASVGTPRSRYEFTVNEDITIYVK